MLRPERSIERVYLHRAPIDMRKQIDGLAALVEGVLRLDPFASSLFVFINRRRDKLKMLAWDASGFIVWYKRLEQEKFAWPHRSHETVVTLSGEQLCPPVGASAPVGAAPVGAGPGAAPVGAGPGNRENTIKDRRSVL